ncbi:MAG: hypothetical protein KDC95_20820, partial [Planctomycetes bacterium]|nr:hypothetical protein [Planctomycetota bacterium]
MSRRLFLCTAFVSCLTTMPAAQDPVPCGDVLPYELSVATPRRATTNTAAMLLDERIVRVAGRSWLQLEFGELAFGPDAILEFESLLDGAKACWTGRDRGRRFSPFFNGDAVRLRVYAPAMDGLTRYRVVNVGAGRDLRTVDPASLCGSDDRLPSSDKRVARLLLRFKNGYSYCTAFLVSPTTDGRAWNCFATSGTCLALPGLDSVVAQFAVPASLGDGTIQHPAPSEQYLASGQSAFATGPAGQDWGLFSTLPNATTGMHAGVAQGAGLRFATNVTLFPVTLFGFGSSQLDPRLSGTQQAGSGMVVSATGDVLAHRADTSGGCSGAPLVDSAGDVVGIQIDGGCDAQPSSANRGTLATVAAFVAARKAFCEERADFVATSMALSNTTLEAGRTVEFRCQVANEGSLATPATPCGYYLGKQSTLATSDRLLAAFTLPAIVARGSIGHRVDVPLPLDLASGSRYAGVIVDDQDRVTEWNETDNVAVSNVMCVGYPNLVATSVQPTQTQWNAGGSVAIDTVVENHGGDAAPPSVSALVLSEDATISTADRLLATIGTPSLAAAEKHPFRETVTVPLDVKSADHWVGLIADRNNQIVESLETDNTLGAQVRCIGLPELQAASIDCSAPELRPTLPFSLTAHIDNAGEVASAATTVRFVLSDDDTVSTNDTLLGTGQLPALAAKAMTTVKIDATAPAVLPTGTCYVGFEIDPGRLVKEQTRANNTNVRSVKCSNQAPLPNLVPVLFTVGTTNLVAGRPVQLDLVVRNDGFVTSLPTRVGFYLSDDATISTTDTLLETGDLAGLIPTAELRVTRTPSMPPTLKTGACWIGVFVDDQNLVPETSESDNTDARAATCTALPDLVASNMQASTTAWNANDRVTLTTSTANRGGAQSVEVSVAYYLSDDAIIDGRDTLLYTTTFAPLAATGVRTLKHSVTIPTSVASGTCYCGVVLDRFDAMVEIDENNNTAAVRGTCTALPDLVCQNLEVLDTKLTAGTSTSVRVVVENRGGAASPPTDVVFVLTSSASGTLNEPMLGVVSLPSLPASGSFDLTTRHDVPHATRGPTRFVTAFVDAPNLVSEGNENDNTRSIQLSIVEATNARRSLEWEPIYPFATTAVATLLLKDRATIPGADLDLTMPADGGSIYILAWSGNKQIFVYDLLSDLSLSLLGGPMFPNWVGFLDANGRARAAFR